MSTPWIALSASAAYLLACLGVLAYWRGRRSKNRLLERVRPREDGARPPLLRQLDAWLRRTRFGRLLARRIAGAGLHIPVVTFCLLALGGAALAHLAVAAVLAPFFGPPAAATVLYAAYMVLERRRKQRGERFVNQLPEIARVLSNAASAGLAVRTALAMAADEIEDPAGEELRQVCEGMRLGQPVTDALEQLHVRLPSRELDVLVTTLVLSARAGGSLVTALQNISATLEARKELRREVRTQLAQVIATTYMVPAMGVGSLLLINAIQPGSLRLMTGSLVGQAVLFVSAALYVLGTILIRRITRIEN